MAGFDGKHALVSGGGTGVGAAIAMALVDAGAKVTLAGRREEPLAQVASQSDKIIYATADVTRTEEVRACFDHAERAFGPVSIVIANAGAAASKPFGKMNADDMNNMYSVNVLGTFNVWQEGAKRLGKDSWGRLIAIASTAGLKGYAYVSAYCAAKHGVIGLTRALAQEFATSGMTVNAICPGYTETPLLERTIENIVEKTGMSQEAAAQVLKKDNPQGKFIQSAEVANAALWLCSEEAGAVTGQAISVSGGEV